MFKSRNIHIFLHIFLIIIVFVLCYHYKTFDRVVAKISNVDPDAKIQYDLALSMFDSYPNKTRDIVMLGDSITNNGNWHEYLIKDASNQGVSSDTTEGMLKRMDYIYKVNPKKCFIMAGINDIFKNTPVQTIFDNYVLIVQNLKSRGIEPIIESTLYNAKKYENGKFNSKVNELDQKLLNYAKENNIAYLDINEVLSKDGYLKEEYTWDGIHLYGNAYKLWSALINKSEK